MAKEYVPYTGAVVTREEAKAQGLSRFFTGKPCKHGHLSQRTTCNGGCIQCNEETSRALYYAETPEQRAERRTKNNRWKDANREQVRAAGRAYQKANKAKRNAWAAANREHLKHGETHMAQEPQHPHGGPPGQDKPRAEPKAAAPKPDPQAEKAAREATAHASIGAQIILDYNSDAGKGARGGAGGSIEENTMVRDANLVALGLDPVDCSGPPPSPEELAARRKREEEAAKQAAEPKHVDGNATKMSSLAAGIDKDSVPEPAPPPTSRAA